MGLSFSKWDLRTGAVRLRLRRLLLVSVTSTCTPRALITALESLNSAKELEATGRFKDIDEKTEGEGSAWLEAHLDACDVYSRIVVVENLSMITSTSHHHLQLDALLDIFVPTETSFGLIVNTATAEQMDDACRREGETAEELLARQKKWHHWIYLEVNFDPLQPYYALQVCYADSQSNMEQGLKRHDVVKAAARDLAVAVACRLRW